MNTSMFFIIGIVAVPFIFVIIIMIIKSIDKSKRMEIKADLYAKAIEKGIELPDDFLMEPKNHPKSLRSGILLIFIGIGISLYMYLNNESGDVKQSVATGLIPFFLGLGLLVVHFVFKKQGIPDDED